MSLVRRDEKKSRVIFFYKSEKDFDENEKFSDDKSLRFVIKKSARFLS